MSFTGRPNTPNKIVRFLSREVRIPVSPMDIKDFLEIKLDYETDHSEMDDELCTDIIRIIPENITER